MLTKGASVSDMSNNTDESSMCGTRQMLMLVDNIWMAIEISNILNPVCWNHLELLYEIILFTAECALNIMQLFHDRNNTSK